MRSRKTIAVVILCCVFSAGSLAQRNEVSFSVGAVFTSDQQTFLGGLACPLNLPNCNGPFNSSTSTGFALEGAYTRRLFNFRAFSLGLEFPFAVVPGRDVTMTLGGSAASTVSQSSFFVTPSARIGLLPSSPVSPFFSIGGGMARQTVGSSITGGALQYGGGLDFKTPLAHVAIRAEARDFWAGGFHSGSFPVSGRQHNVFAGVGVVLKF